MDLKAEKVSLKKLLADMDEQFQIPNYQRPYAWTSEQVDDLWDDITTNLKSGHFLGSLVLAVEEEDKPEVIDGQQRLTTLMLLLAAVRDELYELGAIESAHDIQTRFKADGPGDGAFKFRTGDANWEVFRDFVLRSPGDPARKPWTEFKQLDASVRARNKPLAANAERLRGHLAQWLSAEQPAERIDALVRLYKPILGKVELVAIRVGNVGDAFLLFETLNDRGLQLSAADLLKSHLLAKLSAEEGMDGVGEVADAWDSMIDSLRGADVTRFLRHVLLVEQPKVQQTQVFDLFKAKVKANHPRPVFQRLRELARWYGEFNDPISVQNADIRKVLLDLQTLRATSCYVALLPARKYLSDDDFLDFARLCERLVFRYSSVVGLGTNDLERIYHEAAKVIDQSDGAAVEEARSILVRAAPRSDRFRPAFERLAMGRQYLVRYALERIEREVADQSEFQLKSAAKVHIEHVMPQSWQKHWTESLGERASEADEYVNRWGNLTLLLGTWNVSASNGAFDVKRDAYAQSKVSITRDLVKYREWGPDQIVERQRWMAEVADHIWSVDRSMEPNVVARLVPQDARSSFLSALPDQLRSIVGPLCVETDGAAAMELRADVVAHSRKHPGPDSEAIASQLLGLIDHANRFHANARCVLRGAVDYYLSADDLVPDTQEDGFADDRTVLDAARKVLLGQGNAS